MGDGVMGMGWTMQGGIGRHVRRALTVAATALSGAGLLVMVEDAPAGADTATFTSADIGSSGDTPQFTETGPWTMAWSYDCASFGATGNFGAIINQPDTDLSEDQGPDELGLSGSGTDYYYDGGLMSISVISECDWSITVTASSGAVLSTPTTFSSTETGDAGNPQEFRVTSNWTLAWSYDCSSLGAQGNFIVDIGQPPGDLALDVGPNELGTGGSGTDSYGDTGVFAIDVVSECAWSVAISSSGSLVNTTPPVTTSTNAVGLVPTPDGQGYWVASADGQVIPYGDAASLGGTPSLANPSNPVVAIAAASSGAGYYLVTASGAVYTFGSAVYQGGVTQALNKPVVGMAVDPATGGYWLLGGDGGVFSYNAPFYGSTGNIKLNRPAVGMVATADGGGYWFVASDGGVFSFGNASFHGSTGSLILNKPVIGMTVVPGGGGYRLVASDGGIFSFNAPFYGSEGGQAIPASIVGMAEDPSTGGYWMVDSNGTVTNFNAGSFGAA